MGGNRKVSGLDTGCSKTFSRPISPTVTQMTHPWRCSSTAGSCGVFCMGKNHCCFVTDCLASYIWQLASVHLLTCRTTWHLWPWYVALEDAQWWALRCFPVKGCVFSGRCWWQVLRFGALSSCFWSSIMNPGFILTDDATENVHTSAIVPLPMMKGVIPVVAVVLFC